MCSRGLLRRLQGVNPPPSKPHPPGPPTSQHSQTIVHLTVTEWDSIHTPNNMQVLLRCLVHTAEFFTQIITENMQFD